MKTSFTMKQLGELLRITTKEAIELVKLNHIEIIKPVGGWEAVSRADAEKLLGYPIPPEWDNVGIPLEQTLEEIKKMKRLKEQINTSNPNPTNKMNKNNAYFTCKAVGDAVGLTSQTISAWRDKGELEAVGTHIKRESVLTKWGQAVLDKLDGTTSIEEKDNDDPDSSILAEIKTAKATLELKKLQLELQKLSAEAEGWTFNKIKETKEQIQKDTELLQKRGTELKLLEQTLITKQSNVPVISLIECSAATRMKEIEVPERLYEVLVSAWKETDHVNLWGFILELYHDWDKELYADSKLDSQRTDFDDEMEELEKRTEDNKISQRATLKGQKIEMWVPYLSEFPYDNGDVIPIKDSVDFITLNGRTKQHITDILFQDVQTGDRADYIPPSSNKGMVKKFIEELNNPHLRFELYARGDTDDTFHLVNHNH